MRYAEICFLVMCGVVMASARPRYFVIPVEDLQFLDLSPVEHHRVARQAPAYVPRKTPIYSKNSAAPSEYDADSAASEGRAARQAGHHDHGHDDHVDYGAHTGHHGAFGWYADFPVHAHEH